MKRQIISLGLMLAASFTLTNCTKETIDTQAPEENGIPFEILASVAETKTTNNGMATNWATGDQINVFHAVAGTTTYVNDNNFTVSKDMLAEGKFYGTASGIDEAQSYDWFAFYPYSSYIKTPANTSAGYMPVGSKSGQNQTQKGYDSMAHIAGANYPVAGYAKAVSGSATPKLTLSHVSTLLEIVVTNTVDDPLTVSNVTLTAATDIVGTYYINFAGDITPDSFKGSGDSYVSKTASLNVTNGTALAKGQSAKFYLAVRPFTAKAGEKLKLTVNGYSKELGITADATFSAGKITTMNFGYDKVKAPVSANTDVLNRELTGIEDATSSYTSWSGKSSNTSAVYAGQSAGSNNSIQLRSSNNNSGIISTKSAGYVKKIEIEWNTNTAAGRVLNVYGKANAYSSPEELYSTANQGTLLGTIICGTSTELTIDGNYAYVGLRSADGAMYISEIRITWSQEAVETSPLVSISASGQKLEFNVGEVFNFDGVLKATYEDGTSKNVAPTSVSNPDMSTAGVKKIVITYTEGDITKTFEYEITVSVSSESWTQITSIDQIVSGEYVIVAKTKSKTGYLPSTTTSSAPTFTTTGLTINNGTIASVSDEMKFTFTVANQNDITIKNAAGNYLYITNTNNGVRIGGTSIKWKIANHDTAGTFKFSATATNTIRFLGVYNEQDWRCYTTYNAGNFTNDKGSSAIYLYKKN